MADDIFQLQRQAAQRVQRTHEHNRRVFEEHEGRTAESLAAARVPMRSYLHESPHDAPKHPTTISHPAPAPACQDEAAELENRLFSLEIEQWLLLGLALLLYRNGCRLELTLALLYLAL